MKAGQPNLTGKVIPFPKRPRDNRHQVDDVQPNRILRLLDLSKFEQDRHTAEHGTNMRANIAAIVLLALLVFIATEDFYKLEQLNPCLHTWESSN